MIYLKLQNLEQSYAAEFNKTYVKRHCECNIQNMDTCTIVKIRFFLSPFVRGEASFKI